MKNVLPTSAIENISLLKRAYESCIHEVEHSTLTPLVFSVTGGMGHEDEATIFSKRLASLLSEKWKLQYWVRSGANYRFAFFSQPYNVSLVFTRPLLKVCSS